MKRGILLGFALALLCASAVLAEGDKEKGKASATGSAAAPEAGKGLVTDKIPKSWYQPFKTASQMNIKSFKQSPMLNDRVAKGQLPPVEQRLPKDPPVTEPLEKVGKYGGMVESTALNLGFANTNMQHVAGSEAASGLVTPDGNHVVPWLVKDWSYSADFKTITYKLREGYKWSDGSPFTADDYVFTWKYVANNTTLTPLVPAKWSAPVTDVQKIDDYTVAIKYAVAVPREAEWVAMDQFMTQVNVLPSRFMQKFLPAFVDEAKLTQMAQEAGFKRWDELFLSIVRDSQDHPEYKYVIPTLRPYVPVQRTETFVEYERNPYFPVVDTAGNQLPYIDKMRMYKVNDVQMAVGKMITGESTIEGRNINADQVPLYKSNEAKGGYRTLIYADYSGSKVGVNVNLSHKDPDMRKLFLDKRFRIALSVAINRDEINQRVYYGMATPTQTTVNKLNKYYDPKFSAAYSQYDVAMSKKLLDEIGMKDVNGDGFREMPNGKAFFPELVYAPADFDPTKVFELVRQHWAAIGINVNVKYIERNFDAKRTANDFDMGVNTANQVTDLAFGHPNSLPFCWAPARGSTNLSWGPWPGFITWASTDGKSGIEPPAEIKTIIDLADTVRFDTDPAKRDQAGKALVQAQADNLWTIGIAFETPLPIMVKNNLKNVPEKGVWDWGSRYMRPYRPWQFYLE